MDKKFSLRLYSAEKSGLRQILNTRKAGYPQKSDKGFYPFFTGPQEKTQSETPWTRYMN